jgi:hypothetical protein
MEHDPQTRKEKKGSKKSPKDSIYTSRRVRQLEAMLETKGLRVKTILPENGKKEKKEKKD